MGFRALVTRKGADGGIESAVEEVGDEHLPEGNVLVGLDWAGFNYKDALCLTGKNGLVRFYPHVGGIDFAGRVIESQDERYHPGQGVILTGWRVGETRDRLSTIPGTVPPPTAWPKGCRFRDRCPYAWERCESEHPPLYQIGAGHVSRCHLAEEPERRARPHLALVEQVAVA